MAPAVTAGAAAAEFAAKTFPSIAQIYENAARLRAQGGGGRGGGGGEPGSTGGPVQVLPSGDEGGLYQVEAAANRQQRAMDLGFEAEQDPVGRHIALQEHFRLERQQNAQDAQMRQMQLMNPDLFGRQQQGQPGQQDQGPPPITWSPDDESQLAGAMQANTDLRETYNKGSMTASDYYKLKQPLQAQQDALQQKQRAAQEQGERQKQQAEMKQDLHQTALAVARGRGLVSNMPSAPADIRGLPPDRWFPDAKGNWKNVNETKQLEMMRAWHARELEFIRQQAKDRSERDSTAMYHKDRAMAVKELSGEPGAPAPTQEKIAARMAEIKAHRDLWTGKTPPPAAGAPGMTQDQYQQNYQGLRDSMFGSTPHPNVAPRAPVPAEEVSQGPYEGSLGAI